MPSSPSTAPASSTAPTPLLAVGVVAAGLSALVAVSGFERGNTTVLFACIATVLSVMHLAERLIAHRRLPLRTRDIVGLALVVGAASAIITAGTPAAPVSLVAAIAGWVGASLLRR